MKITINRDHALDALNRVRGVIAGKITIPILTHVLMTADGDGIVLRASDLDMQATAAMPCEVAEEGATAIPAAALYDAIRFLPEGAAIEMSRTDEDPRLIIRSGKSVTRLPTRTAAEFPIMKEADLVHWGDIDAPVLARMIAKTAYAMHTSEGAFHLCGVHFHTVGEEDGRLLRAVATDTVRLALIEVGAPARAGPLTGFTLTDKTLKAVIRLIEEEDEPVQISTFEGLVRFTIAAGSIVSKIIDGSYPDYPRIIPQSAPDIATIDVRDLRSALNRINVVSGDSDRAVRANFTKGRLGFECRNTQSGEATDELEIAYDGPPLHFTLSARKLLDGVSQVAGATAEISIHHLDAVKKFVIRTPERTDEFSLLAPYGA